MILVRFFPVLSRTGVIFCLVMSRCRKLFEFFPPRSEVPVVFFFFFFPPTARTKELRLKCKPSCQICVRYYIQTSALVTYPHSSRGCIIKFQFSVIPTRRRGLLKEFRTRPSQVPRMIFVPVIDSRNTR